MTSDRPIIRYLQWGGRMAVRWLNLSIVREDAGPQAPGWAEQLWRLVVPARRTDPIEPPPLDPIELSLPDPLPADAPFDPYAPPRTPLRPPVPGAQLTVFSFWLTISLILALVIAALALLGRFR